MKPPPLSEQLGDKPAPPALQPLQAFVNTLDIDEGTDLLSDPADAREWLRREGLVGARSSVDQAQLTKVREVRESLRALLAHNGGGPAPTSTQLRPLRALARSRRPRLDIAASGEVEMRAASGADFRDGLLGLLVAIRDAQADGTWERLKVCGNSECRWAFFDRSRNRGGTWCDMAVCGNRLKNREFRARHR
jgi:predicted RNA-binding Zn ribbon-like protein